ncbi:MAG: bacteriohemerythrin [Sideroxydans sp.]|nr:bacteriohemerythrin [Sideroxydans sp.]
MSYLHWSDDLNTGISVIDSQHRRIVDLINQLNTSNDSGDHEKINAVLAELIDYTLSHFAFEEELQLKAEYPFFKAHKRVHEVFAKRIAQFQIRANNGENVATEVLSLLRIWLVNHIKGDDRDYVDIVKKTLGLQATEPKDQVWVVSLLKKVFG